MREIEIFESGYYKSIGRFYYQNRGQLQRSISRRIRGFGKKTAPSRFRPRWVQSIAKRIIENGLSLAEIVLFEIGTLKNVKIELGIRLTHQL